MKRSWALKWARDLEAKGRRQATGTLREGSAYCCLGRACVVAGMKPAEIDGSSLPESVIEKFGMKTDIGTLSALPNNWDHLARANDNGLTFKEIAQIIRKRWREL